MKRNRFEQYGLGRVNRVLAIVLTVWGLVGAYATAVAAEEALSPPDSAAIFEQARIAGKQVLFTQDFEGPVADNYMSIWYTNPGSPCRMVYSGVTEEQVFSGKHAYKVQVLFRPGATFGAVYIRLPIQIPIWSDLKLSWRIKTETSPKITLNPFHGFSDGDAAIGSESNVGKGVGSKVNEENGKVSEKDGWELWQASLHSGSLRSASDVKHVEDYASGVSLYIETGPIEKPTTVTFYVDDITIEGKLPTDWKKQWADVYRYFRTAAPVK